MAKPPPPVTVTHNSVTTSYGSAALAFAAAQNGDTVTFGKGTYDIGAQAVNRDITIMGTKDTVLNGGLQIDSSVHTVNVHDLSIINGAVNSDWTATPIGIYSFGSTHLTVNNVTFEDKSGPVDMVGISARTAGPGAGSEFDITNSEFRNLSNGVDVENGNSADIYRSTFHNAAIVTNNYDATDHLSVINSKFEGHSGFVFIEGNQWENLALLDNKGNDKYYFYGVADGYAVPVVEIGKDVLLSHAHVGTHDFFV